MSFARTVAPRGIDVDVAEFDDHIALKLKLDFGVGTEIAGIAKSTYQETNAEEDAAIERTIAERTKQQITNHIQRYREDYFKMVLQNLDVENRLRREDEIYGINHFYEYEEAPNFTRRENLDLYYRERVKKDFPFFDTVWQSLVNGNFAHEHSQELLEYANGIMERYKQALFGKDLLSELLHKKPDNDIVFLVNFHFYYYITVIKALGDSLAWILNYFYSMKLEDRPSQIDLTKTRFQEKLRRANEQLFQEICQGSVYDNFKKLKEFRDIVVHRHALHVVTVQFGVNGESRIMVPIDPARGTLVSAWNRQKDHAMNKKSVAEYGLMQLMIYLGSGGEDLGYDDVLDYCDTHLRFITESYNRTFEVLSAPRTDNNAQVEKQFFV